jgi:hypothetical protein
MKFTRNKLMLIVLVTILSLLLSILSLEKNKSKHKKGKNNNDKMTGPRSPKKIKIAKNICNKSCNQEKIEFEKIYSKDKKKKPYEMTTSLYARLRDINTEFYVCECLFTSSKALLNRVFYFANKNNIDLFYKNDSDGIIVYNRLFGGNKKTKEYMHIK